MKVIDLLNKIANGEEVPQKIKVGNKVYNYETFNIGKGDNYFTAEWEEVKGYRINYDGTYYYLKIRDYNLNDEVEIIEEEKKIPEKLDMVLLGQCDNWLQPTIETDEKIRAELNPYVIDTIRENTLEIQHKFNEIIDYLKSKGE